VTDAVMEILRSIQSTLGQLREEVHANVNATKGHSISVRLLTDEVNSFHQEMRMIRSAINDVARENVTVGEVAAIHDDLNRLQRNYHDLAVKVEMIEAT
jgi:archaellum component FlaC